MKKKKKNIMAGCPNCKMKVPYTGLKDNPYFPFCSERCKLIDLDMWLIEEHKIESDLKDYYE